MTDRPESRDKPRNIGGRNKTGKPAGAKGMKVFRKKRGTEKDRERGRDNAEAKKPKAARTTPTGNVIKIWREGFNDKNPAEESGEKREESTGTKAPRKTTGRKLWVKGKGHSRTGDAPPPGHDKHKDITTYFVEEQEKLQAERLKKKIERKRRASMPKPVKPSATKPTVDIPVSASEVIPSQDDIEIYEPEVERIFTIGFSGISVQKMLQKLVDMGVTIAIDMRTDEAMLQPGFSKARDLAILFKEAAGIEYRREDILIPRRELCASYIHDRNWSRFTSAYIAQLRRMKVDKTLNRRMFSMHSVAILGDQANAEEDLRAVAAQFLKDAWNITVVTHL